MGTRLYPQTTNIEVLELLAGVPAGTHTALHALEEKFKGDESGFYNALTPETTGRYSHFRLFGWGSLNFPAMKQIMGKKEDEHVDIYGEIYPHEKATIEKVLHAHNIPTVDDCVIVESDAIESQLVPFDALEGLCWS